MKDTIASAGVNQATTWGTLTAVYPTSGLAIKRVRLLVGVARPKLYLDNLAFLKVNKWVWPSLNNASCVFLSPISLMCEILKTPHSYSTSCFNVKVAWITYEMLRFVHFLLSKESYKNRFSKRWNPIIWLFCHSFQIQCKNRWIVGRSLHQYEIWKN